MSTTDHLLGLAKSHMTPNYNPPPFVAQRGEGVRLWDVEGREYLDFAGGMGVNALGHAHPKVVEAISTQAGLLCHTSNSLHHRTYIELCERLCKISFAEAVYLCNSGAEAVEAALKLARRHFFASQPQRTEYVATENSFHGRTMGALSVTGQETYRAGFAPLVPGAHFVPYNDLEAMKRVVSERTAAVIVEPIQGNGGVYVPSPGYLKGLRELCTQRGCLLIFDEVQTGIGRTGQWFAYEHEQVVPDVMSLAKALGGGLPLGAMVTTRDLAACLQPGTHATTFGGNPVACAAGLATLGVIEREHLLARAQTLGNSYRAMLKQLQNRHAAIQEIRGRGLLVGILLNQPIKEFQATCRNGGLLGTAAGAKVYRLFPALTVTEADLLRSVEIMDRALQSLPAI